MPYLTATKSSLNGFFKQIHLPKLEKLIPEDDHLIRDIPFESGEKLGEQFRQPVYLTMPHGATYAASNSAPDLNAPIAAQTKELIFDAYQIILRERVSYDAADRMASSKASYASSTGELPLWLRLSHTHKAESLMWYGQASGGLGAVSSISSNTLTITVASWAAGIWQGAENLRCDVYTSTTFTKTVQVTSVDLDNHTITVDNASGITAADVLHFSGSYGNTMRGIFDIIEESTDQWGVNPTTYNLLKGVSQSAAGATLKFKFLLQGMAKARAKSSGGKMKLYVNEFTFVDLIDEVDAARTDPMRGGKEMKGTNIERGADNMSVVGPGFKFDIQVSTFCKRGSAAALIQDGSWKRLGTSDITSSVPGSNSEDFYMHLENIAGYEMRTWSNFANYTPRPGPNVSFGSIVNGVDGGI